MHQLAHNDIPRLDPALVKERDRHPVKLLLDHIRSAHNVGSMLRTADGFLIDEVIMAGYTPDGHHRGVHKSALGAQDFVPWRAVETPVETLHSLRNDGWRLAALEITETPKRVDDLELSDYPLVIVAGNEVDGVTSDVLEVCDFALELPQFGAKQSLNVSVAAGIVCHELVQRYRTLKGLPPFPEHDQRIGASR